MNLVSKVRDGLRDLVTGIEHHFSNASFYDRVVSDPECNAISKSGIGGRIINLKTEWALKNGLNTENDEQREFYEKLEPKIYKAVRSMLTFGRGVIVINNNDSDLTKPLNSVNINTASFLYFGGANYNVAAMEIDNDILSDRYYMPKKYNIRGKQFHHSRVIDFTYIEPDLIDKPKYQYGGISEPEFIYEQLVQDGIMQNTIPAIFKKISTLVFKHPEFNQHLENNTQDKVIEYFRNMTSMHKASGSIVTDTETAVDSLSMSIPNVADVNSFTLQRLGIATGIPVSFLTGEAVKGLNAVGDHEETMMVATITSLQQRYIYPKIKELFEKAGVSTTKIKINSSKEETPTEKIERERTILENANKIYTLGADPSQYLNDNDIEITADSEYATKEE